MSDTMQSYKWLLTLENPLDYGFDRERILQQLNLFSLDYCCLCDEIGGKTGTPHTHIFIYTHSPTRFRTVQRRFPTAHIDKVDGTAKAMRDYITKTGKWADTEKADTSVEGSFYEQGVLPSEEEERSPRMFKLLQQVKEGRSTLDIIEETPNLALRTREINNLQQIYLAKRFRSEFREVEVHYIFGETGAGKTYGIYQKHDPEKICRITDYGGRNGVRFDAYDGHEVLVFEEFHSQIPIGPMLNYLDKYPLTLPARYNDRVACYTTVYITSNIPLEQQYQDVQQHKPETWRAFLRRICTVTEYKAGGITEVIYDQR